jgi:hypothetical protein
MTAKIQYGDNPPSSHGPVACLDADRPFLGIRSGAIPPAVSTRRLVQDSNRGHGRAKAPQARTRVFSPGLGVLWLALALQRPWNAGTSAAEEQRVASIAVATSAAHLPHGTRERRGVRATPSFANSLTLNRPMSTQMDSQGSSPAGPALSFLAAPPRTADVREHRPRVTEKRLSSQQIRSIERNS